MSEVYEGVAIVVPSESELSNFNSLDKEQQTKLLDQVEEMQTQVADALLQSDSGWKIVFELNRQATEAILGTRDFMLGVNQNMNKILAVVEDPENFRKSVQVLSADIGRLGLQLGEIRNMHVGKTPASQITDVDIDLIANIAEKYSSFITTYDNVVLPLYNALITILAHHSAQLQEKATV